MSSLPASIKRIRSKTTEKRWRHHFPHYKSMGAFCCHGHQSFDPICPKTLCSLSPTPVMLHIKFDQDRPTSFRDIQDWKCGRRRTDDDDGPLVYYKLTLWAFGSGALKRKHEFGEQLKQGLQIGIRWVVGVLQFCFLCRLTWSERLAQFSISDMVNLKSTVKIRKFGHPQNCRKYPKNPKNLDTWKIAVIVLTFY